MDRLGVYKVDYFIRLTTLLFFMSMNIFLEEQQLKLAMARSLQEDDDADVDADEICEPDSQTDYMEKTVNKFFICII